MENNDTASLDTRLTDGSLYQRAPVHLRGQVLARVRAEAEDDARRRAPVRPARRASRNPFAAPWPFFGGAFAGATLSALVLGTMLWFQVVPLVSSVSTGSPIAQEIVSSHVRALMSDRPIDVLSSDKHTVKPWFNGRIDYAPPVIDPAGPGFALVGGRLDYIDHRPVAVVVYRYLKHPIDVYVFPEHKGEAKTEPAVTQSDDGYALAKWNHDGMTFWAVTDASGSVLRQFAQAMETGAPR
ncbi:transmembrane transcriptional regulator (anti-sigma factor) [Caballeronia fortuita]|uniref:Transmembrane transcriptional regulator (Anti-sigma factor) n=1 Tax=Caballeronia fortuita TaxID=1777138 RepID=A0A158DB08_9BURK|nr:anti-sigma factor [Caballeronia fortuita]SAK91386.1 transmembrane transcriptional regulator (anti-sigma factor) [Caballeronia fortuita]